VAAALRGIRRLLAVAVIAVVAFVVALFSFRQPPASECEMKSVVDPSYQVQLEEQPRVNTQTYHLLVTRHDRAVTGAQVCMRLDMGGPGRMPGMVASNVAQEVAPGRYRIPIRLVMAGPWRGRVVVDASGREPVAIPLARIIVS
jgi:hypothetical protein